MGCYDTIVFFCPECKARLSGQSKSGDCVCSLYNHSSVPTSVAYDANRHAPFKCSCGKSWAFGNIPEFSDINVKLTIEESTT